MLINLSVLSESVGDASRTWTVVAFEDFEEKALRGLKEYKQNQGFCWED